MTQDLTQKNPFGLILKFTLPLLVGNLIQQFYYIIDSVFVSVFVGPQALAGVGIASTIDFILFGFAYGACNGFCIILAQKFGAKRKKGIKFSVSSAFYLYIGFTVFLTVIGVVLTKPLLNLMDTPKNIFNFAQDYLIILFLGSFSQIAYMLLVGMLKSVGDNKTPLFILILTSILNIILDYFAVCTLKMQTKGAAIATVVAQAISCILCLIFIYKKYKFMWPKKKEWNLKKHYIFSEIKIGVPMALEFSITGLGIIILQKAVNSFGENIIAGFAIAMKVENLVITTFFALATATSTFTAQNFGAKKFKRIVKGAKASFLIGMGFCVIFTLMVFLLWNQISALFLNSNIINSECENSIKNAAKLYLNIAAFNFPILCILINFRSLLQSLGKTLIPLLSSFCELLMRFLGAVVLAKIFGYVGACFSPIAAWYGAFILVIISFFYNIKKLKKIKPF